jgi:hypothetical protein
MDAVTNFLELTRHLLFDAIAATLLLAGLVGFIKRLAGKK